MNPLVMVHLNGARIDNGVFKVDRKFHLGMLAYAEKIKAPLVAINPHAEGNTTMDLIEVPLSQLPYRVMTFKIDRARRPLEVEIPRLCHEIEGAQLIYGDGFGAAEIAH